MEMGEKNSFGISRYKIAAALVCAIVLTAAVSALMTLVVLENTGHGLHGGQAPADFAGVYEIGSGIRLSLLPGEDDVDGGRAPFYIYEMSDDPDDDSLKVQVTGESEPGGKNCIVLYDEDGVLASLIYTGGTYYYQKTGKTGSVPKEVRKTDDTAVALE